MPFPAPDAPDAIEIQSDAEAELQAQPDAAITATFPAPLLAFADWLAGVTEKLQEPLAPVPVPVPAWVTVRFCPAAWRMPVRAVLPELAATEYVTVPLPLPVAPLVTVIQSAVLDAVHEHPVAAITTA